MKLRGVLLDLDGTLVDHDAAVTAALRGWLPTLGAPATAETIELWRTIQDRHVIDWRAGRISFAEQRRRRLRDFLPRIGVPIPDHADRLDTVFGGYLRWYARSWHAYDDVEDGLAAIDRAGLRRAVLTNGMVEQQNAKLAAVGLAGRVGPVYAADGLGVAKPDPAAYLMACQRWGVEPGAVLHVGDDYLLDVRGPRAAGLRAVHLDRLGTGPVEEPDRITTLRGLAALLPAG